MVIRRVALPVALLLMAPAAARAQESTEAMATALFDEGMKLMERGKYAEACPKLARSHQLAPTGGTVLNLGECYEKNGQLASAWAAYRQAAARAADAGKRDFETMALDRAKKLEPKLARVTVKVAKPVDGLEIKRDGETVARAEWDVASAVDGGTHRYEASAPGLRAWRGTITIGPGEAKTLAIPALDSESAAAPAPGDDAGSAGAPSREGSTQRTIGLGLAGAGAVGIVVGSVFGLKAISKNSDANAFCPRAENLCSQEGVDLGEDAKSAAAVSTVMFVGGGALLTAGVVLLLTAPSSPPPSRASLVNVGFVPGGATLGAGGRW